MLIRCRSDFFFTKIAASSAYSRSVRWHGLGGFEMSFCNADGPENVSCNRGLFSQTRHKDPMKAMHVFSEFAALFSEQSNGGYVFRC